MEFTSKIKSGRRIFKPREAATRSNANRFDLSADFSPSSSSVLDGAKNFRLEMETCRKNRREERVKRGRGEEDDIATKAASRRLGNKDGELRIPGM